MEDNTLDFLNPLEPLGTPNDANLASNLPSELQGLDNTLRDPQINFPKHYDASPLTYMETKENLVDSPTHKSNASQGILKPEDILKSLGNMWKGNMAQDTAGVKRAKVYSYDNSADSGAFYKRYAAYGQEKFDKIGFSPLRDNEAIFNEHTSMWNDFSRMMTHSWWPLFKQGFIAGPKSLYRAMQGDFGSDLDDAAIYAEAAAIGQSSKGGVSAFMSNAFMNFAYTAGIITESIVEMGAATLLAVPTGGSSLGVAGANLGRKGLMLGRLNNMRKAGALAPGVEATATKSMTAKQFSETLVGLKNIDNSRKLFNWAKVEKGLGSGLGRFVNPFAELSEGIIAGVNQSKNLTGWSKAMTIGRNTAGGLYRNIHTINASLAEARLEGGMIENDVYDKLYRSLTPEEREDESKLKAIRAQAQAAGTEGLIANMAVIYISNKIVFDNIYGGKGPLSRLMNKRTQDIMDLKTGKLRIRKPGSKIAGQVIKKPVVEYTKNNFKNMVKDFVREPITKSSRGALTYFKGNVMEGLQENTQEAIQAYAEGYYVESFKNPELATTEFARAQMLHGIREQFTAQGAETFLSGFVMGAFAGPLNSAPRWASIGYNRLKDPVKYQEYIDKRDNYGNKLAETLNAVTIKDFYDNPIWTYSSQSKFNQRLFEASTEEETNALFIERERQNAFISAMSIAMEKDMLELYTAQVDAIQNMSQEEFEEAYGLEKGQGAQYLENVQTIKSRINDVQSRWKEAKELFPEPEDIGQLMDDSDPNSIEYEQASLLLAAWKEARRNYVFFHESFKNTQKLMAKISEDITKIAGSMDIGSNNIRLLFDKGLLKNEKGLLKNDIELLQSMEELTADQKQELKEKTDRLENLTALGDAIQDFEKANLSKQELLGAIKESLKSEGVELTNKDAQLFAEQLYETNKENIHEQYVRLDISLKEYLRHLLKDKDYVFKQEQNVDEIVKIYTTYLEMDNQQKDMARIINIVSDEQGYVDMVQRNMIWMKDLYDRRREYYDEFIKKGFEHLENNDLLNLLADKGVYISPEALTDWIENGNIPEEFYIKNGEMVISEGHHKYPELAAEFYRIASNRQKPTDVTSKQYQDKIDALKKQRDAEIEALKKMTVEESKGPLTIKKPTTLAQFADQIFPNTYARLRYIEDGEEKTLVVYQDKDGLFKYDNEEGNPFDDTTTKFESGELFIMVDRPESQEAVDEINERYAKLIAEVEGQMRAHKAKQGKAMSDITTDTPYSDMPQDLKNELSEAYLSYARKNGIPIPEDAQVSEDDIMNFIKTNTTAKNIITKYNSELNSTLEQPDNYDPIFIDKNGKERKASEFTEKQLNSTIKNLDFQIKDLQKKDDLTLEEQTKLNELEATKIELETYLKHVREKGYTDIQRSIKRTFDEKVKALQEEIKTPDETNSDTYDVKGSEKTRVTNLTRDIKPDPFENKDLPGLIEAFNNHLKDKPLTKEALDNFKKELKNSKFSSLAKTNTFTSFISELESLSTEGRVLTEEEFATVVNKWQWQEARDAGTYIHAGIEALFNGGTVQLDRNIITEEVYEQLFGDNGIVRSLIRDLKSNNMMLLGMETIVFDEQYAGSIDMLLVDPQGTIHVIDIKTGKSSKWSEFGKKGDNNKTSYALQLAAYRVLLTKMFNANIKTTSSMLPIQIEFDNNGIVTKAKLPTQVSGLIPQGKKLVPISIAEPIEVLDNKSAFQAITEHISPRFKIEEVAQGIKVATDINPKLREKLINAGIPEEIINQMTKAEQEEFQSYKDVNDQVNFVNSLREKYSQQTTTELTDDQILEQEITVEEERNTNAAKINEVVRILKNRQSKLRTDIANVQDTLTYLNSLLNETTELSNAQIDAIISKIQTLEKIIDSNIENRKKSGAKSWITRYKGQIKEEYSLLNDLADRVRELSQELEQLESISKDYTNQINYYNNLLADPNYTTFSKEELTTKLNDLKKKAGTVSRLISAIKQAIKNTLKYIAEYLNIANTYQKDMGKVVAEKYNKEKLTSTEYDSMLRDINEREVKINQALEDAQFLEEVQEKEEARLEELQSALSKYNDQIRYLANLIDGIETVSTKEVQKVKDSNEPKPTTKVPNASETIKRNETKAKQAVLKQALVTQTATVFDPVSGDVITYDLSVADESSAEVKIINTFTLPEQKPTISSKLKPYMERLEKARNLQEATNIGKELRRDVNVNNAEIEQFITRFKQLKQQGKWVTKNITAPVKKLTIQDIKVGDQLIEISTGKPYKVMAKTAKGIQVKGQKSAASLMLNDENIGNFTKKEDMGKTVQPEFVKETVTEEEVKAAQNNVDETGVFINNTAITTPLVEAAKQENLDKIEEDLLNDIKC
jgi:hypothetical protein